MINWEDLTLETSERFGGTLPHPDTADAIAAVYAKAPTAVLRAIDRVANQYQAGEITSPWGILLHRVKQIQTTERATTRSNDRDKAIARAEQWIRTTGLHYDREAELLDELYGERGRLRGHPETQTRMLQLWTELRPLGELTEHQATERGHRYQHQRAALANTQPTSETQDQRTARQKQLAAQKAHTSP